MSSSPYQIVNRWSTPSAPGVGIDRLFQQSDQHYYMHKCEHCGYYNQMSYDPYTPEASVENRGNVLCVNPKGIDIIAKTVVDGSFQYVCQKCGKPLDRWYNGVWVPKFPERAKNNQGTRGYLISQMSAVWISIDELKRKELSSMSKQSFYNYSLGYAFADTKMTINLQDIEKSMADDMPGIPKNRENYSFVSVGIDWGNVHSVVIHGVRPNGRIDMIKNFQVTKANPLNPDAIDTDIQALRLQLAPYDPDIIVADIGDSGDKVAKLIQIYGKDKVFGCKYPSSPKSTGNVVPTWSTTGNLVKADKLMQNKRYITKLKDGEIKFPHVMTDTIRMFADHWSNVIIRDEEDENSPDGFIQKISRKSDDHYAQSAVYSMLGYEYLMNIWNNNGADREFDSDWLNMNLTPTKPDIFAQFG